MLKREPEQADMHTLIRPVSAWRRPPWGVILFLMCCGGVVAGDTARGQLPPTFGTTPAGINVTQQLRGHNLSTDPKAADNHARLGAALLDKANNDTFYFPAGGFYFTDTIAIPNRATYRIVGAGAGRNSAESQWTGPRGWGGNTTRWIWIGPEGGTFMAVPGQAFQFDGVRMESNPRNGTPGVTRAGIAIHYQSSNKGPNSTRMHLGNIVIDGPDCGIFCGVDKAAAENPDASGDYAGHRATHADTIMADRLGLRDVQQAGIWIANEQSVGHDFRQVEALTFPDPQVPLFKIQRGGGIRVGFADILNSATLLEIWRPTTITNYVASFHCDAQAKQTCLVRYVTTYAKDRNYRSQVVIGPGNIPDRSTGYVIDTGVAGRNGTTTLIGVRGLYPGCIKINGTVGRDGVRHMHVVNLIGCEITKGDDVAALVDTNESTTLWRLNWSDCTTARHTVDGVVYANLPLADGTAKADDVPLASVHRRRRAQYAWYDRPESGLRQYASFGDGPADPRFETVYGRGTELRQVIGDARFALENGPIGSATADAQARSARAADF